MPRITPVDWKTLECVFKKAGFVFDRGKGDHRSYVKPGECESELQSTLEDWVLVGLKLGHRLPVIEGYDLNKEPTDESVAAM